MILRRVIAHFRKQEWTAIVIDFVIVVIGVFVGLQVNNWNEGQQDRRREAQIVEDLLADLEIDRTHYASGLEAGERRVNAANASLRGAGLAPIDFDWARTPTDVVDYTFDVGGDDADPAEQRDRLWSNVVLGFHPTPSTATFDALVGAGEIGIIKDRAIVREIQRYRNITGSVMSQNEKVLAIRGDVLLIGARNGLAPYLRTTPDVYFSLVAADPELAAAIRIMATFAIYHHGEIKAADARAAALQASLKNYQAARR